MAQFLSAASPEVFEGLVGEKDSAIESETDFVTLPNHVMTHPLMFTTLDGAGVAKANEAGAKFVQTLLQIQEEATDDNEEEVQTFIDGCHLPLVYIWATCKGLTKGVTLSNPPESETVDEEGSCLVDRLKKMEDGRGSAKKKRRNQRSTSSKKSRPEDEDTGEASVKSGRTAAGPDPEQDPDPDPDHDTSSTDSSVSKSSERAKKPSISGEEALLSSKRIVSALIQNLSVNTARQIEDKERDRKKASMTSRMSPETEKMFSLLSARDWKDTKPTTNTFVRLLLEDRGMARAVEIVQSEMKRWDGSITGNGLIQFLSTGYINKNLDDKPGGFTFFMFRPSYVEGGHNPKLMEQSIRESFGDNKLSDDTIKYYAKMNFFLPATYEDFIVQLETAFKFLELFTRRKGIASEGYRKAFRVMSEDKRRYRPLFTVDPTMGIRIGRYLDNIFQNFCIDLADYAFESEPIKRAQRRLEYGMGDKVARFFDDVRGGIVPSVLLPESLTAAGSGSTHSAITDDSSGRSSQKSGRKGSLVPERVTNPEADEECKIPKGRRFGEFFTPSRADLKANCASWPTFPHQIPPGKDMPMCLKFQTTGGCTKDCKHSHVLPSDMSPKVWQEIRERIKKIFKA